VRSAGKRSARLPRPCPSLVWLHAHRCNGALAKKEPPRGAAAAAAALDWPVEFALLPAQHRDHFIKRPAGFGSGRREEVAAAGLIASVAAIASLVTRIQPRPSGRPGTGVPCGPVGSRGPGPLRPAQPAGPWRPAQGAGGGSLRRSLLPTRSYTMPSVRPGPLLGPRLGPRSGPSLPDLKPSFAAPACRWRGRRASHGPRQRLWQRRPARGGRRRRRGCGAGPAAAPRRPRPAGTAGVPAPGQAAEHVCGDGKADRGAQ
jgi:hypothetical protein